jgi:hypothetical protein
MDVLVRDKRQHFPAYIWVRPGTVNFNLAMGYIFERKLFHYIISGNPQEHYPSAFAYHPDSLVKSTLRPGTFKALIHSYSA